MQCGKEWHYLDRCRFMNFDLIHWGFYMKSLPYDLLNKVQMIYNEQISDMATAFYQRE